MSRKARIDATTPHKEAGGSLFLGSNFVFDARGATRVTDDVRGWCDGCGGRTDRVDACASEGCHTLLLVCAPCAVGHRPSEETEKEKAKETLNPKKGGEVFCCVSCEAQDAERKKKRGKKKRRPCDCDGYAARERRLLPEKPAEGGVARVDDFEKTSFKDA